MAYILGSLDHLVLTAISTEKEVSTQEIIEFCKVITKRDSHSLNISSTLNRQIQKGTILNSQRRKFIRNGTEHWVEYYTLTENGKEKLREAIEFYAKLRSLSRV